MADQNSSSTPSDVISQATATDAGSLEVQDRHTHPEKDSKFALLFSIWCAIANSAVGVSGLSNTARLFKDDPPLVWW